jgi:hypothetical protein
VTITETNDFDRRFSKSDISNGPAEACLGTKPNLQTLKFEREDWTLFRTVDGLQQKAGVPAKLLQCLVLKELGDNALDTGAQIRCGEFDEDVFYIEDDGPGLDGTPEEIAELFSIRRPMRSTKLLRLPQRGALGNGLRVAAGAVLASGGQLAVETRNRRILLQPQSDGSTSVVDVMEVDHPIGTRIEIAFGGGLRREDKYPLEWIRSARGAAGGESYDGRSSPHWYDGAQFHELLLALGAQPVRSLIAQLDGCSGGKAGEIVTEAGLERKTCNEVSRADAIRLLKAARYHARPVNPKRLGGIGPDRFANTFYAVERGEIEIGSVEPLAEVPFVIEVWARKETGHEQDGKRDDVDALLLINRTPPISELSVSRYDDKMTLRGAGLGHYTTKAPRKGCYFITINVTTPYCPITSDGKAPDLEPFVDEIIAAVVSAMGKAQRAAPKDKKLYQKDVVLNNLDEIVALVSGDLKYRFGERQILYKLWIASKSN